MKKTIVIFFMISFLYVFAAIVTVQVGSVKFHINDNSELAMYEWNGKVNDDCRCWKGDKMDCWFETVESNNTIITHETGTSDITISGKIDGIPVKVIKETGENLNLISNSSNFEISNSWIVINDDWFEDIPIGTIIDVESFITDEYGNFVVNGLIRQ